MGLYPGQRLNNYRLKNQIACGGMGQVWLAWDEERGVNVAIKTIADNLFVDPNFTKRFFDEGRRHIKLNHPNIVPVYDVFSAEHYNCLVMAFIEGASLADILDNQPDYRMPLATAIPIVQDILGALNYAHKHGIIHRDIKPANILIYKKNGRGFLIDFGIALAIGEDRRTCTGQSIGTPHYMSPEQITNPKGIDHRTDVYSVGCVFYEMLTGRPPFVAEMATGGETDFAIKRAHVNLIPKPPTERVNTIPAYINDVILFALEKKPENRLPGCQEFLRLLQVGETKPIVKIRKSRRPYLYLLVATVITLIVVISVLLIK
ncbi:MAG: serine/threonine protein kinase [Methylococcaceae bacterium]|nr:serine/threonine protein kinase [Methylococcaceae bacterium]